MGDSGVDDAVAEAEPEEQWWDLLDQARTGSAEAAARLFARFNRPLNAFFHRRGLGDHRDREEAILDTWKVLFSPTRQWVPGKHFEALLFTVAGNAGSNTFRRPSRRREVAMAPTDLEDLEPPSGRLWEPSWTGKLEHVLAKLDPKDRRHIEEVMTEPRGRPNWAALGHSEGVSPDAARMKRQRILRQLRGLLGDDTRREES